MKTAPCRTCRGTGTITEVSTNDQGHTQATCWDCGGFGYKQTPDGASNAHRTVTDRDDPEPLGIWIFLIAAGLGMEKLGVMVGLGPAMTDLPIWYYPIAIGIPGLLAWRFTEWVANITFLVVGLVIVAFVVLFVASLIF